MPPISSFFSLCFSIFSLQATVRAAAAAPPQPVAATATAPPPPAVVVLPPNTANNLIHLLVWLLSFPLSDDEGFTKVMVEGDSKLIIDVVQGQWGIRRRVSSIINDIRILTRSFSHVDWKHIFREANFVADALVHLGLSLLNPHYWDFYLPDVALVTFNFDCIGNGCTRGFVL
ncbi:hypothetical protein DVH24_003805 [Malus domestica]|uniref:RNase H type-1 domain-containing protein n=1 Tax=Malus domestica TaxID=3750 RepID=A0A498KC96_MALDO|nr:hypothetical protein DVH24_003805 [Malus domestica]